jgi:hypothetical protein
MSPLELLREKLEFDQDAISKLINEFGQLEARYTTLTEDPTAVTPQSLQGFIAEIDSFRVRGNEILGNFRTLTAEIRALPGGPVGATEREALQAAVTQLRSSTSDWITNTYTPFRAVAREEAARVTREAAAVEANAKLSAKPVGEYTAVKNDGSGPGAVDTWYVTGPGGVIEGSGLTETAAIALADSASVRTAEEVVTAPGPGAQPDAGAFRAVFNDGTGPGPVGTWYVLAPDGSTPLSGKSQAEAEAEAARLNAAQAQAEVSAATETSAAAADAATQTTLTDSMRQQAKLAEQLRRAARGDWRVRLSLAPGAGYLYNAVDVQGRPNSGILEPLYYTDGVIFPYTPAITTTYNAGYSDVALTHSNYKGYFYQSSYVGDIGIDTMFTAQDTGEANYLLAVIHFFRSVTKMFYGQDAQRGAPPPLVFLQGLGEMQFNRHPCVVKTFNYTLPADVDYIRARTTNISNSDVAGLQNRRDRASTPINQYNPQTTRLNAANLTKGAVRDASAPPTLGVGDLNSSPTYVPTKINIQLTLLPIQTRTQQSQQFSLEQFANGKLQKGGFW